MKKKDLYVKSKLFYGSMKILFSILASFGIFLLQSDSNVYFIKVCFSGAGFWGEKLKMSSWMKPNSIFDLRGQDENPSLLAHLTVISSLCFIMRIGLVTYESPRCGSSWRWLCAQNTHVGIRGCRMHNTVDFLSNHKMLGSQKKML